MTKEVIIPEKIWASHEGIKSIPTLSLSKQLSAIIPGSLYKNYYDYNNATYYLATDAYVFLRGHQKSVLFQKVKITEGPSGHPEQTTITLVDEFYFQDWGNQGHVSKDAYKNPLWNQFDVNQNDVKGGVTPGWSSFISANNVQSTQGVTITLGKVSTTAPAKIDLGKFLNLIPTTTSTASSPGTAAPAAPAAPTLTQSSPIAVANNNQLSITNSRSSVPSTGANAATPKTIDPNSAPKNTSTQTTSVNVATTTPGIAVGTVPIDKPYLLQRYSLSDTAANSFQNVSNIVVMDIIPNSFEFSQLSSVWSEVDRGGTYSITDWNKYNLMKVSFKFVVAARIGNSVHEDIVDVRKKGNQVTTTSVTVGSSSPLDGLNGDIDSQLQIIRKMAQAPYPITLVNCSNYLTNNIRFPYKSDGNGIAFIISDMSVSITRFSKGITKASTAEVSVSLTEYVAPQVGTLVKLPPLKKATIKPGKKDPNNPDAQYASLDTLYQNSAAGDPLVPNGTTSDVTIIG
jgi:hypothetical protein